MVLSSVPRQSGGYFRYAQRHVRTVFQLCYSGLDINMPVVVHVKVVDCPVMAQMTFPLVASADHRDSPAAVH